MVGTVRVVGGGQGGGSTGQIIFDRSCTAFSHETATRCFSAGILLNPKPPNTPGPNSWDPLRIYMAAPRPSSMC